MGHSQTIIDDKRVPSVTETLSVVGKAFLWTWYKREVAKHGARGWAKCDAVSNRGKRIGTHMHGFIEEGLGGPAYTPWMYEERRILEPKRRVSLAKTLAKLVLDWLSDNKIKVVAKEQKVISREDRYGGTFDAILEFSQMLVMADWKSSNSMDKWYTVQVAAYIKAHNENHPEAPINSGVVVRADKKAKKPYLQINQYHNVERYYRLFKACREIYDFDRGTGDWEK
jgi:hypothetical protein